MHQMLYIKTRWYVSWTCKCIVGIYVRSRSAVAVTAARFWVDQLS
jgi:hypothetical protein